MYYAEVTVFDGFEGKEQTFYCMISAHSYEEAVKEIENQLDNIEGIKIEQINDFSLITYLPKEAVKQIIEENMC